MEVDQGDGHSDRGEHEDGVNASWRADSPTRGVDLSSSAGDHGHETQIEAPDLARDEAGERNAMLVDGEEPGVLGSDASEGAGNTGGKSPWKHCL